VKYQNTTPVAASITINGVTATSGPSESVDESATNLEAAIASLVSSGAIHDIAVTRIGNEISLTSTSPGATFAASSAGTSNDSLINMGFSQIQAPVLGIDAPELPAVTTTDGVGGGEGVPQVSTITFPAMKIGQSVSIAGLAFTATSELTGDQVAEAFANIADSGTTGSQQALGVYSGTLTGFGGGTPIGNQLPFTCSQINDDAVDIPISVNDPIEPPITPFVQITQGQTNPSTIADFDAALDQVLIVRSALGGYINHLAYAGDNVTNTSSNTTQSRSIMVDTDYAIETADLIKHQIRQQAAMAMLAQANALPQTVLSLLRG
jgi:flagellin